MTIKDEYLFFNGKQKPFVNNSFHTFENKNQCSNLNLNQSYKCQILSPVHSKSKLLNDKYCVSDNFEEKEKLQACKKPSKISNFTILNDESNKSWKNSSNPNNSSSTISLHIKPYENPVKAVALNSFDFLEKGKSEIFKENQNFTVSTLNVQNPFEFPRQQSDKASAPELSQFKASQRLLNSNKAPGMNPQQPLPTGHLDIRPELRLAHQRQMMQQQQQQQQQQGQRPPQPYPPHYPPGGLPEQYPRGNSPMQFQPQQSMMPQSSQMDFQMNQPPHGHMYPQRLPHPPHPGTGYPSQSQYPPSGPQDAAMRQAQMQHMRQQQLQQHQFQQQQQQQHHQQSQQQQPPQQIIPPQPPIELQMNEPNPNLPVHLAQIPIQFPGPGPSNELESTVKSEWIEKITRLTPRPLFHPNLLENLSSKSVGFLCGIGKDVIQELVIRMVSITAILKVPNWKTNAFAEVELILSYSKFLIEKIREIRAHVDRKTIANQKLSANDFIELMALPTAPQLPKKVQELRDTYLGNENFLFRVSNAFKKVEWLGENADPRNASLIFKDEIARINAAEDARRQPSNPNPKKP